MPNQEGARLEVRPGEESAGAASRSAFYGTILLVLLVIQVTVISVSVAGASIAFGLSLGLLAYWCLRERSWPFAKSPYDYYFLAYAAVELLTAATAIYPAEAFVNAKRLFLIANVYMVVLALSTRERVLNTLLLLFGTVGLLSIVEISYYFLAHEGRLSVFQHYMTTGGIKMIVCLLALPFLIHKETPSVFRRWVALLSVPTLVALILTNTRSSWVGFVAAVSVLSYLKNRMLFLGLVGFVVLFFLFAPASQVNRAKSIIDPNDVTNHTRLVMWSTGLKIFADHPILGIGDSDVHKVYVQYKSPDDQEPGGHLHNVFVMLLVTLGSVGFTVVCSLFVKILVTEHGVFRALSGDWLAGSTALGALAAFIGFLVNGFFEWNFGDHEIMVLIWFSVGLALAVRRLGVAERP
ncbi:MAG TPA: O-antigen ligase family protein [Bacteroidota bacterium]|nr:O-antigen ligase family protein [Bacteroidota bacterium]